MGVQSIDYMNADTLAPAASLPTVLVVDDEVLIRWIAGEILRDAGYDVVEAATADEAVKLLTAGVVCDVIFSDVNMPGAMDGLGLAAHVARTHPALPLVLTSGRMARDELERPGVAAVLPKPYSEAELTRTIRRVLEVSDG